MGLVCITWASPRKTYLEYETALKAGKYVLIVHGVLDDTTQAKEILNRTKPEILEHHQLKPKRRKAALRVKKRG